MLSIACQALPGETSLPSMGSDEDGISCALITKAHHTVLPAIMGSFPRRQKTESASDVEMQTLAAGAICEEAKLRVLKFTLCSLSMLLVELKDGDYKTLQNNQGSKSNIISVMLAGNMAAGAPHASLRAFEACAPPHFKP